MQEIYSLLSPFFSLPPQLSPRAVKDYNRGRAYLTSIANKKHVAIFSDPVDAALCAVYMVKGYEIPSTETVPLQGTSV